TNIAGAAYIGLGNLLHEWGKLDEAAEAYWKCIAVNRPETLFAAHFCLGNVLAQQNKLDEAIASYRKVIELQPNSPRSHSILACILATRPEANLRDSKEAVELARRATEIAPGSVEAWQFRGWIHYQTGDWKSSIEALEKSCRLQQGGT